jgi:transposase-like protein
VTFRLTYLMLIRVLGWLVLLTRSENTKGHRDPRPAPRDRRPTPPDRTTKAHLGRPGPAQRAAEELRRLRKENAELRRANEILKAASASFAQEMDPTRRKY